MRAMYWFGVVLACSIMAGAEDVPPSFNYQGVLRGGSGEHLPAGTKTVSFRLYTSPSDPSIKAIWGRQCAVLLDTNGLFNVTLNDSTGSQAGNLAPGANLSLTKAIASHSTLYVGVTVEGSAGEISPRQQLLSVPYALMAGDVKNASGSFAVNGTLTVEGTNALVASTVTAKDHLQIGSAQSVQLTASAQGVLEVPALDVSGNTTMRGNLMADKTVTASNLVVTGNTTLQGTVSIFSTTTPALGEQILLSSNQTSVLMTAPSDGFIVITFNWIIDTWNHFGASHDKADQNKVKLGIEFSGGQIPRTIPHGFEIWDLDCSTYTKWDTLTLPVLKGESVAIKPDQWVVNESTTIYVQKLFVPFGMSK